MFRTHKLLTKKLETEVFQGRARVLLGCASPAIRLVTGYWLLFTVYCLLFTDLIKRHLRQQCQVVLYLLTIPN